MYRYEIVGADRHEEFDEFVRRHPKGHLQQSFAWSRQKSLWKFYGIVVRTGSGEIGGVMSVLIRRIPLTPWTLMYAARGPVCDIHDREMLACLLDGAKMLAKKNRCYVLKLDPDVTFAETEFMRHMEELGFVLAPKALNFENIQPQYVMRLDIAGKTEEEVMAGFKPKTRYNIRLAQRKGVEIKICGREAVDEFYRLMVETGERDHFRVRPARYFSDMLDNLGENVRLYMAYYEGRAIAGTIAARLGEKMWYLYGSSSNLHRNVMPNYLLQWEMIRWAIESGCKLYDFKGISGDLREENHLYGLYRFKSGFNAEFTEFVGEYRYIFHPLAFRFVERALPVAKKIVSRILQLSLV